MSTRSLPCGAGLVLAYALLLLVGCSEQSKPASQPASPTRSTATPQASSATPAAVDPAIAADPTPVVELHTSKGVIVVQLDRVKAPLTVANFLRYVEEKFYDGTVFHRVISDFMIQGGGFTPQLSRKDTHAPIHNEADNGLKNLRGTLAMARTSMVHSASSQFFINVKDNDFLNHTRKDSQGYGYCVFGQVIEGMDVVDRIKQVATGNQQGMGDVPNEPVVIEKAIRRPATAAGQAG